MGSAPAFPSSSSAMVVITVVGILAAFALLASYYAFVTRCQLLRAAPWRSGRGGEPSSSSAAAAPGVEQPRRGLGLPLIRMIPVVRFTAGEEAGRRSSECAVCLSEFVERERVRLLPGCSHAFHIDCIDTWLQGSARCPFCRRSVTLPPPLLLPPPRHGHHGDGDRPRRDERLCGSDSIVIEVRGERESWGNGKVRMKKAVGDEAVESRRKEEFAVEPVRRSLSMDSSCDKHKLYVSVVKEFLAQRQQVP
uniref:Uncharacterized protein n=1 Tax=Avena sativa TaxID=4498 RepID=A0ACD5WQN8_AVESA